MKQTILLADDNSIVRELFSEVLTLDGYEVIAAKDGIEAFNLFKRVLVDLIITDIVMPGKDGLELIRDIRKQNNTIPIIAISGSETLKNDKSFYLKISGSLGANRIMEKPIKPDDLLKEIKKLIG